MDNRMKQLRSQPCVSSFANKLVVIQFRIGPIYPVNLLFLSGTESLLRIQAPNTLEQALSPQYFMQSGDAPREVVTCIKKCRIGIGHRYTLSEHRLRYRPIRQPAAFPQKVNRTLRPNRPVAQQAPDDAEFSLLAVDLEAVGRDQIHHDIVIVTSVQRDLSARFGNGPDNIQSVVTIERRNLYRYHIFDLHKLAPELVGKHAAADRWLQVETDNRQDLNNLPAMADERFVIQISCRSQAQKTRAVF